MSLPFFYESELQQAASHFTLSEETSRHCIQVLRMKSGEKLLLTNGKGLICTASIAGEDRKKAVAVIEKKEQSPPPHRKISIAISLLKNTGRFEWFLEKATEIGITDIQPLLCSRTEHTRFKTERMQGILISAMLQSQQPWLPVLHEPAAFDSVVTAGTWQQKLVAHCLDGSKQTLLTIPPANEVQLLIGPEGDFTPAEITLALDNSYTAVTLGNTRLRTETAGMVAAALLANR
jgi:16S rRNA (uracil1498-N3)-methyltransferase